jgi:hypothetical protein
VTARPLQNRVDPFGALHAVSARGTLMGNRGGRFHRDDQTLGRRRWASRQWIACVCEFKGRRRSVWGRYYTELFFLDEYTALAAGHRPCFECRRAEAQAFRAAFASQATMSAPEIDRRLHDERQVEGRKRLHSVRISSLPDGAMITRGAQAYLLRGDALLPWSWEGYGAPIARAARGHVDALTPPSICRALAAGYIGRRR